MSEGKNTGDKTISVTKRPLGLKPRSGIERDTVRQSFSHGRTNTVQVERKKRRVTLPGEKPEAPAPTVVARPVVEAAPALSRPAADVEAASAAAAQRPELTAPLMVASSKKSCIAR